jgi:hypothetical protein
VLNVFVHNHFFATPAIRVDLNVSMDYVAIRVLMSRRSSSFGAFREATAPNDTEDDADKANTEAHPEGNKPA